MGTTRRDLFKLLGGSAVGALFTPAPWRLITDTALWSENWPGIPRPGSGEIRMRYTNCSLCPAGCAMRARCVGDQPVSLAGVKGHPLSHGALCPWGIAAHQLPYHPARLRRGPVERAAAAAADAIALCGAREHVAVLDLRPGRTASWTYRRAMAAVPHGLYIATPQAEWAFDLAAARTVLSLGAPLADGWGTPGNVFAARNTFRLIQADPVETRTAGFADAWLPIRPGSASALASAVAGEIPIAEAARQTGLAADHIRGLIAELHDNGPSLVLARNMSPEAMRANVALGAPGHTIVGRRETPVPEAWRKSAPVTMLDAVPDGSIRVLFIDESAPGDYFPWSAIAPKLANDSLVIAFAWTNEGYGRHAQFTLPAPVFTETLDDLPPAVDAVTAVFRLTLPLIAPQAVVVKPLEFIARLAGLPSDEALHERANAIHKTARGHVFTPGDGATTPLKSLSADNFWKALHQGACWLDTPCQGACRDLVSAGQEPRQPAIQAGLPLALVAGDSTGPSLSSPLTSKLYRESNLRQPANRVALAPETARASGVASGARAILETVAARLPVTVAVDPGLPPDVVRVAGRAARALGARGKVVPA